MVELKAPELVARHEQMQAQAKLDRKLVEAATETVAEARAEVKRYQADVDRWDSEVKRLTGLVKDRVVDQQVLDETRRQLKSSQATLEASRQAVNTREAQRLAAEAKVEVSDAEVRRQAALVDYLTIKAPYDGIVFVRNVNTDDMVLPATGDPSEANAALGVAPNKSTPMYVFFRTDPMLFIVGVPESDAPYVAPGTPAKVRIPSLDGRVIEAKVKRTSEALNSTSRTVITQIEL